MMKIEVTKEWCEKMAKLEGDSEIGAGAGSMRYRHKERGTTYQVLYFATMQTEGDLDNARVVVYQGEQNSAIYVRPYNEFFDGRFEELRS